MSDEAAKTDAGSQKARWEDIKKTFGRNQFRQGGDQGDPDQFGAVVNGENHPPVTEPHAAFGAALEFADIGPAFVGGGGEIVDSGHDARRQLGGQAPEGAICAVAVDGLEHD